MADSVVSNTNDERLEQLKRQAEAAMRRSAPPLAKRQRVEDDSADVTAGETEKPSRYSYAAVDALFKGITCFLATCTFKREKSATHELCDLLNTVRPGLKLQLVRVDCSGLVVITASQGGAEEDQKAAESDAQQQQQQEQQQQRQPLKASTVVQDILQRVDAGGIKRTRFCQRIIPADATCLLSAASLRAALTAVVEQYLAQHWIHSSSDAQQPPLPFAVMFKHRGRSSSSSSSMEQALCQQPQVPAAATSPTQDILPASVGKELQPQPQQHQELLPLVSDNGVGLDSKPVQQHATAEEGLAAKHPTDPAVDRKMAIDIAAEVVQECCKPYGGAKANLTNPQVVIVLEVIPVARQQPACAVAAVPGSLMICKPKLNLRPVGCAK